MWGPRTSLALLSAGLGGPARGQHRPLSQNGRPGHLREWEQRAGRELLVHWAGTGRGSQERDRWPLFNKEAGWLCMALLWTLKPVKCRQRVLRPWSGRSALLPERRVSYRGRGRVHAREDVCSYLGRGRNMGRGHNKCHQQCIRRTCLNLANYRILHDLNHR